VRENKKFILLMKLFLSNLEWGKKKRKKKEKKRKKKKEKKKKNSFLEMGPETRKG